jgi:hypothetical protein
MPINTATIAKENLELRHSSGNKLTPTDVTDLGNGNFQYVVQRDWKSSDAGNWEIWTTTSAAVANTDGIAIPSQKIGFLDVSITGMAQLLLVTNFSMLDAMGAPLLSKIQLDSLTDQAKANWRNAIGAGSPDLAIELGKLQTANTALADRIKALESRLTTVDLEPPRLVLLDRIPGITEAGNRAVKFRIYIDG